MSTAAPAEAPSASADGNADAGRPPGDGGNTEAGEERDRPQDAWSARRDLRNHIPRQLRPAGGASYGGGQVGGDQFGVSGGSVAGDVLVGGTKTEIHYQFAVDSSSVTAGEVPPVTLERIARSFVSDETAFARLAGRLRDERFLVLTGAAFTGRRTAALMLLRHLGAAPVRILDPVTTPTALTRQLKDRGDAPQGLLLCDPDYGGDQPLREPHLLAAREELITRNAYLIVTMGPTTRLADVPVETWSPPSPADVLAAHLRAQTDERTTRRLLRHEAAVKALADEDTHQLREIAALAEALLRHERGEGHAELSEFARKIVEDQVREWFEEDEENVPLREKAFLIALAVFDGGPYALTAEVADVLYELLQETQASGLRPEIPIFGTHIGKRLQLARAKLFRAREDTDWGPVEQTKAAYRDEKAALVLLREVWTGHPSARPALVKWLQALVADGRPLVRTRAAYSAAALARMDLPSAMALVIEKWASSHLFRQRNAATNALALAHDLGTPNIPRILDDWCDREDEGLCWTAIRALALIGPADPEHSLAALRKAARRLYESNEAKERERDRARVDDRDRERGQQDGQEGPGRHPIRHPRPEEPAAEAGRKPNPKIAQALAESVDLLLLSEAKDTVLADLIRTREVDDPVRNMTLSGFLSACAHVGEAEDDGRPLILSWYAASSSAAPALAMLWRGALGSRQHTTTALSRMRQWVLLADRVPEVEGMLTELLPALVTTGTEHRRLSHLLRTMPGEEGGAPPLAAHRLLAVLDAHRSPSAQGVHHG
ncbi:hypothetical protein GCM10018793_29010 [Streptomyces sulfonofaciens]|uniref:LigA protein n=1 Tax=Streptomyces sulfonofaciens TaxID=68272 RepID=A0A919G671_9ACTN|nr:hypothetical protein [Streptomyces sulfonofaciens]GHH78469.1 hypothetical protein GCM10018793_29010 [Streptomyces sulfonofaciens]